MPSLPAPDEENQLPPLPMEGASPGEVRAALHAEYRPEFDRSFRAALVEAGESFDLGEVIELVESWRRRSWVTRDREAYRQMMRRASELLFGELPPEDEPTALTEERVLSAPGRDAPG